MRTLSGSQRSRPRKGPGARGAHLAEDAGGRSRTPLKRAVKKPEKEPVAEVPTCEATLDASPGTKEEEEREAGLGVRMRLHLKAGRCGI